MAEFLYLNKITKKYRQLTALNNITLDLKEGEIFGYIGTNGAGKTTTIKILTGLIKDFKGEYQIQGKSMPACYDETKSLLGYLPQNPAFQEWRTVYHALHTFGLLSGINSKELDVRIKYVLEPVI